MKNILLILIILIITSSYGGVMVSQLSLDLLEGNYYFEGTESKIIGGSEAEIGEFPYIVSLQRVAQNGVGQSHFCAGSIYDEYTIITSAECGFVNGSVQFTDIFVVAGENNLLDANNYSSTVQVSSVRSIQFPFCTDEQCINYYDDIAILGLTTPLMFNENVAPIQLPEEDYIPEEGTNCTISGWGRVTDNTGDSILSDVLRKVNVPIVSIEACKESSSAPSLLDDNKILCAGSLTGEADFCEYDTGGPLVIEGTNIQIGIASIGYCGSPGKYGVYTRVSYFLSFIKSQSPITITADSSTDATFSTSSVDFSTDFNTSSTDDAPTAAPPFARARTVLIPLVIAFVLTSFVLKTCRHLYMKWCCCDLCLVRETPDEVLDQP